MKPLRRITMPCRWAEAGLAGFRGSVRFIRKFGYPGKAETRLAAEIEPHGADLRELGEAGDQAEQQHAHAVRVLERQLALMQRRRTAPVIK